MSDTTEILRECNKFIADQIALLQELNKNLTGIDVTVTITPDVVSGYESTANSKLFYFPSSPSPKIVPLCCPACLENTEKLIYSFDNSVPVCSPCSKS